MCFMKYKKCSKCLTPDNELVLLTIIPEKTQNQADESFNKF